MIRQDFVKPVADQLHSKRVLGQQNKISISPKEWYFCRSKNNWIEPWKGNNKKRGLAVRSKKSCPVL